MTDRENFSVLIVDDDPVAVHALRMMLDRFAPLRFATTGSTALKLARESRPDLVVLDLELPGMSGFEVCKAIRSDPALTDTAVIFFTANLDDDIRTRCLTLGAADVMMKPGSASLLEAIVRNQQRTRDRLSDTMRNARAIDFMTGCRTRMNLEQTLTQEWARAKRSGTSIALLLVDILEFRLFNETQGEAAGDNCLRRVAETLRSTLQRPADMVARYSGGQFAALLPDTQLSGVQALAQRIRDEIGQITLDSGPCADGHPIDVACGAAVANWNRVEASAMPHQYGNDASLSEREFLKSAERALEKSLSSSKSRVTVVSFFQRSRLDHPADPSSERI